MTSAVDWALKAKHLSMDTDSGFFVGEVKVGLIFLAALLCQLTSAFSFLLTLSLMLIIYELEFNCRTVPMNVAWASSLTSPVNFCSVTSQGRRNVYRPIWKKERKKGPWRRMPRAVHTDSSVVVSGMCANKRHGHTRKE